MVNGVWGCAPVLFCRFVPSPGLPCPATPMLSPFWHPRFTSTAFQSLSLSLSLVLWSLCVAKTKSTPEKGNAFGAQIQQKKPTVELTLTLTAAATATPTVTVTATATAVRRHLASIHLASNGNGNRSGSGTSKGNAKWGIESLDSIQFSISFYSLYFIFVVLLSAAFPLSISISFKMSISLCISNHFSLCKFFDCDPRVT